MISRATITILVSVGRAYHSGYRRSRGTDKLLGTTLPRVYLTPTIIAGLHPNTDLPCSITGSDLITAAVSADPTTEAHC